MDDVEQGFPSVEPAWDIGLGGRSRTVNEYHSRWDVLPEKFEIIDGRLFWSQRERLALLAQLLENVGLVEAVRLAPKELWLAALEQVDA